MAEYPREIFLDDETEERLLSYLDEQLNNHYMERGEYIEDLLRWQKDYWAKPTSERATFPFDGAATIVIPLSAIAVEAIMARTSTQMFALPQFVSAHAISPEWDSVDKPFEKFMDRELLEVIKVRSPLNDCFLEGIKFGTMVGKAGYERIVKTARRTIGNVEQDFQVVVKDGAVFDAVPGSRFLMPFHANDTQFAPWVGEEHTATPYEVKSMEQAGKFRLGTIVNAEGWEKDPNKQSKLHAWISSSAIGSGQEGGKKFDDNQATLENTVPSYPTTIDWVEIWLAFDVDMSGIDREIIVHYHKESRTIMSIRYNWNADLARYYRTGKYFPIEHRWRGIGVCKQNEQFQKEITVQHRQRIDNATLANMRMIVISKLSDYGPSEPIFPGKMWFVDDMSHIDTLQMGEVYPSSYNNEQSALIYSQQRTGVNETTLGMPQVGTPGTATSDLARIQEGNKRFDFWYQNVREFTDSVIVDIACLIQQFGPRNLTYFDTAEHGQMVRQMLQMPEAMIREGLLLRLRTSSQQFNRVLDRQNAQQIAAFLQQYYMGMLQLAQYTGNQELMQLIVQKAFGGSTEVLRQILETFDTRNIDRIILSELEEQVRNGPKATGNGNGGNPGSQELNQAPGMEQLTQIMQIAGGGGNGGVNRISGPV